MIIRNERFKAILLLNDFTNSNRVMFKFTVDTLRLSLTKVKPRDLVYSLSIKTRACR